MIIKKFGKDFHSKEGALTLDPDEVKGIYCGNDYYGNDVCVKVHADGWVIVGKIYDEGIEWVNDFVAY
ncbi:MAG: hypothetical protein ACTSRS_22780, partial [Candidatus Helarchaeota archaeon]